MPLSLIHIYIYIFFANQKNNFSFRSCNRTHIGSPPYCFARMYCLSECRCFHITAFGCARGWVLWESNRLERLGYCVHGPGFPIGRPGAVSVVYCVSGQWGVCPLTLPFRVNIRLGGVGLSSFICKKLLWAIMIPLWALWPAQKEGRNVEIFRVFSCLGR